MNESKQTRKRGLPAWAFAGLMLFLLFGGSAFAAWIGDNGNVVGGHPPPYCDWPDPDGPRIETDYSQRINEKDDRYHFKAHDFSWMLTEGVQGLDCTFDGTDAKTSQVISGAVLQGHSPGDARLFALCRHLQLVRQQREASACPSQ